MAKKQKTEKVKVPVVETPVVETPKPKKTKSDKPKPEQDWVIKDRTYLLKDGAEPVTLTLGCSSIFWFDEEKGYERELRYTSNQKTPFVDEFEKEIQRLAHILYFL